MIHTFENKLKSVPSSKLYKCPTWGFRKAFGFVLSVPNNFSKDSPLEGTITRSNKSSLPPSPHQHHETHAVKSVRDMIGFLYMPPLDKKGEIKACPQKCSIK